MKTGFGKPLLVWMRQIGFAVRYDCIRSDWAHTHCASLFLPLVNVVFTYTVPLPKKLNKVERALPPGSRNPFRPSLSLSPENTSAD